MLPFYFFIFFYFFFIHGSGWPRVRHTGNLLIHPVDTAAARGSRSRRTGQQTRASGGEVEEVEAVAIRPMAEATIAVARGVRSCRDRCKLQANHSGSRGGRSRRTGQ